MEEKYINFIGRGIENCGNSCFMNSVNQMLFHIPELREFMIQNEGLFEIASKKYKRSDPDSEHDYDLLLKLIGLFKKIKENTEEITRYTKIRGDTTLTDLYITVQNEYFNEDINKRLEDFDDKNDPIIEHITKLKEEYEKATTTQKRKDEIKAEMITIIQTNHKEYLIETQEQRTFEDQLKKLIEDSPEDPQILILLQQIDNLKKDITKIPDNIFKRLLENYSSNRNSIYSHPQSTSELFVKYLSTSNINISDSIITNNYDDIIIYNKSNARYAVNYEYMINKINLPFNYFYIKTIEIKKCDNGKKTMNILAYESFLQYKDKFEINLDDISEKVHLTYCNNPGDDIKSHNINTTKKTKYIPNKYILINIGREYNQVFKRIHKIQNIEKEPPTDLETIYDKDTGIITFKEDGVEKVWDKSNETYQLETEEVICRNKIVETDTYFIDPDTNIEYLHKVATPIATAGELDIYVLKPLINDSPISNYDTGKQEMTIKYNDGTKNINYNLIGTICRSGEVEGGHYWYHHKINGVWYKYNDSHLTRDSQPNPKKMLMVLFRREGDEYKIPIYRNVADLKLHILQQIRADVMTYDTELSDDLSKTDKLKEDIERLLYYTHKYGSNTHKIDEELLKINKEFKTKINTILKP